VSVWLGVPDSGTIVTPRCWVFSECTVNSEYVLFVVFCAPKLFLGPLGNLWVPSVSRVAFWRPAGGRKLETVRTLSERSPYFGAQF